MAETQIGAVDHFFSKISVGMIKLTDGLKVGDKILIKSKGGDLNHEVSSMQVNRNPVQEGKAGDIVSVQVAQKIRPGDAVYKITE